MAKRNAGFKAKPKGLCIFIMSLNLWDLATLSPTVGTNVKQVYLKLKILHNILLKWKRGRITNSRAIVAQKSFPICTQYLRNQYASFPLPGWQFASNTLDTQIERKQRRRKKHLCQQNLKVMRAKVINSKVCVFLWSRKIFRILLRTRKSKTKQKAFAKRCGAKGIVSLKPHYS